MNKKGMTPTIPRGGSIWVNRGWWPPV